MELIGIKSQLATEAIFCLFAVFSGVLNQLMYGFLLLESSLLLFIKLFLFLLQLATDKSPINECERWRQQECDYKRILDQTENTWMRACLGKLWKNCCTFTKWRQ